MDLIKEIKKEIKNLTEEETMKYLSDLQKELHELSPHNSSPIDNVQWVDIDLVQANDYNPNSVANKEMQLLYKSISHDGYTQPIVTIYDERIKKYVIVDGFHRYSVCLQNKDIRDITKNKLPIVVIEKDINDRMASTVRHNRARGKHSVDGMANMVFSMLDNGWADEAICNNLGMEAEELLRLKHVTGFSKLFKDIEYQKAWKTKRQIQLEREYKNGH